MYDAEPYLEGEETLVWIYWMQIVTPFESIIQ